MGRKKALKSGDKEQKITPAMKAVVTMLCDEYMTVKQIAIRRKCSVQAIYEIIKKAKNMGVISRNYKLLEKSEGCIQVQSHKIRLHGQQWHIKILFKDSRYKDNIGKQIEVDGNTILLHTYAISVHSNTSFFSKTVNNATLKSMVYWNKLFKRLESMLHVVLVKPRSQNITLVNQHYAEVNNELAKEQEVKGQTFRVRTRDDGKVWLEIDNSLNLHELETRHPKTANDDMQIIKDWANDMRENRPPTNTELKNAFLTQSNINVTLMNETKEIAAGLNLVVQILKSLLNIQNGDIKPTTEQPGKADYIG